MSKKSFLKDSLINLVSSALPLIILQLFSMPLVAREVEPEYFGLVITLISIITVLSFPFGNILNNIRILKDKDYIDKNISGDFNYLLFGSSSISVVLVIIISCTFYETITLINIIFFAIIAIFSVFKEYLIVAFRLTLNFKAILYSNLFLSLGYLFGSGLFYVSGYWELIYITGLVSSLIYIIITTDIIKEPVKTTEYFMSTLKDYSILYIAGLLKSFQNYSDKIILLPLLGPKNVSIYFVATIVGKLVIMFFNPINNVILSYLVKSHKIRKKEMLKAFVLMSVVGIFFYITTILLSPYFFTIFYPDFRNEALELIFITSATAIVTVLAYIFQPFNLRFNKLKWQIYITSSNLILFLIFAYYLSTNYGLIGFSIATLISSLFVLLFQIVVYFLMDEKK